MPEEVPDFNKGERLSAEKMRQLGAAIRGAQRKLATDGPSGVREEAGGLDWRLGIISDQPSGKTQFTDARYWVRWAFIPTQSGVDEAVTGTAITFPTTKFDDGTTAALERSPVCATNLAELAQDGDGVPTATGSTHNLAVGTLVLCLAIDDAVDQYDLARKRWVFSHGGGAPLVTLKITGHTAPSSLAGGAYYARSVTGNAAPSAADLTGTTIALPMTGQTVAAADDYIVIDYSEVDLGTNVHGNDYSGKTPYCLARPEGTTVTVGGTDYGVATVVAIYGGGC
jgi:hypothetical protein